MKLLFDFFPILLFFIAFKMFNIYVATSVAIVASILQVGYFRLKFHRFETMHLVSMIVILVLGGATLLLHDIMFIKWKPTVIYWLFALLFLVTQFIGERTLLQRIMDNKISLPQTVWNRLNTSWTIFFTVMGFVNLYIVYHYSTNAWVNFKLFGTLGLTIGFVIMQSFYMAKYIKKIS